MLKKLLLGEGGVRRSFGGALPTFIYFCGAILFWEIFMHIALFWEMDWRILFVVLFSLSFAGLFSALTTFLPKTVNTILIWLFSVLLYAWFAAQLIYFKIFGGFISLNVVGMGGDAIYYFFNLLLDAMITNLWLLIALLLPLGILLLLQIKKVLGSKRAPLCVSMSGVAVCLLFFVAAVLLLPISGTGTYSIYDVYYNVNTSTDTSVYNLGILTTLRIEAKYMLSPSKSVEDTGADNIVIMDPSDLDSILGSLNKNDSTSDTSSVDDGSDTTDTTEPPAPVVRREDQVLDIDFDALIAEAEAEGNSALATLHKYFSLQTPTQTNEYTGYFEGKNLIYMVCEGFSPLVISEELTPTLYKLSTEGFVFNNFYTSYKNKTTNGEYTACLGIFPDLSREYMDNGSFAASAKNYLPFALGNVFQSQLGIKSHAYHNYYSSYYNRKKSHPNMGYTFKAMNKGMTFTYDWPSSDLEMMQQSIKDYVGEEQFHAYYMTFSGHTPYSFSSNPISNINRNSVSHLSFSETVKAYIACHLELEKAMTYLMDELEAAGKLEDTVIVMTSDHYPYGLGNSPYKYYSELAGYTVDGDFGIYKNSFICWSYGMEDPIEIDTPCCTVDILPTILNLFGFEYDSRLLVGRDVLDPNALHMAVLYNGSFVTDRVMFCATSGKVTYLTDESNVPTGYIDVLNKMVQNEFSVSTSILNYDYYRIVLGNSDKKQ